MTDIGKNIFIGTAGWSYKDWYGIVYPENPDKGFKTLDFIANFFDTVEINSTFYAPANSFMGNRWVSKVAHNDRFQFTAKLWQRFTHDRTEFNSEDVRKYLDGIDPIALSGRLGAILCQFPWSFKNCDENRKWISKIINGFNDYPLVFELRHRSWDRNETYEFLDRMGVGIVAIDQPVIGESIEFKPLRTGNIGYVRLHGRNYEKWFSTGQSGNGKKSDPSARYDYLYSEEEIREIAEKVMIVSKESEKTFVIQNNHPWGQAVANASQLKAALGESDIRVPETMFKRFPELKKIAKL